SKPAARNSACSCCSRHRSGPSARKPRSALWPSTANDTTWWSSAWHAFTAAAIASASAPGLVLQNRCSTPHPTEGETGDVTTRVYEPLSSTDAPARPRGAAGWPVGRGPDGRGPASAGRDPFGRAPEGQDPAAALG